MSQHTPGPWTRQNKGIPTGLSARHEVVAGRRVICRMGGLNEDDYANARLIAKAPEMYRLIKLSLQAGRFPEMGDGYEQWKPAEVARTLLREIE